MNLTASMPGSDGNEGSRLKMEELFFYWLGQKGTAKLIKNMIDAASIGKPIEKSSNSFFASLTPPSNLNSGSSPGGHISPRNQGLPKSPNSKISRIHIKNISSDIAEHFVSPKSTPRNDNSLTELVPERVSVPRDPKPDLSFQIPKFYFPREGNKGRGHSLESGRFDLRRSEILEKFQHPLGNTLDDFVPVTKNLCGFPSFFNAVLFQRILRYYGGSINTAPNEEKRIPIQQFSRFWKNEIEPYDHIERFFRVVKQPNKNFIGKEDFTPFIAELLKYHPGLDFLQSHPDFHPKYSATVTARIFYTVNRGGNGRITLRELRKSNLVAMFNEVDEEEDINKVTQFFSYEHFYVLFCRFYELDSDRDNRLSKENLMKYGDHALSSVIVDRIFEVGPRPFEPDPNMGPNWRQWMTYQDYVYFMLSEEDRGNEISIRYWFKCVDLDDDGKIDQHEMRYFYDAQVRRMESLGQEVVAYGDMLCLIWDMLHIGHKPFLTLDDFLKPDTMKIAGVFFDCLFNLGKFIAFEQRDPFSERQKRSDPFEADWDRFAYHDYNRLAAEDERETGDAEGVDLDGNDEWAMDEDRTMTLEAPF